jgi:hypothetical protein
MFNVPNNVVFEEVVNYLLKIIDCKKCEELYLWPLVSVKEKFQFRNAVKTFVTYINKVNN